MDPLKIGSRCGRCQKPMKARKDALGDVDGTVVGCAACGQYGMAGDDRVFDRKELGDEVLEAKLRHRAIKLKENENALQKRYTDAKDGRIWS